MTWKNDLIYALCLIVLAIILGVGNNLMRSSGADIPNKAKELQWFGSPPSPIPTAGGLAR